jgi:signal peptidase II
MFQDLKYGPVLLTLVAVVAFGLVIHYLRKTDDGHTRMHAALGLVGGGAIGNLIDRIQYQKVTDFIVWHIKDHEWPAFNVADAALVVGVCLMALDMWLTKQPTAQEQQP